MCYTYEVTKIHTKDENYFSNMSLQSSYWGGFLAADGCIYPPNNCVTVELSIKDLSILERFKLNIDWTGSIRYRNRVKSNSDMCSVQVTASKKYIKDLEEIYSITQAKTFTLQPPNIKEDNKLAYLVGLIDGDGHIGIYGKNKDRYKLQISTASIILAMWLKQELNELSNSDSVRTPLVGNTYQVSLTGVYARTALLKLQAIPVEKLDRKWGYDFSIAPIENSRIGSGTGCTTKIGIDTAREIKASYTGERGDYQRLADEYGLNKSYIRELIKGRSWKCLHGE